MSAMMASLSVYETARRRTSTRAGKEKNSGVFVRKPVIATRLSWPDHTPIGCAGHARRPRASGRHKPARKTPVVRRRVSAAVRAVCRTRDMRLIRGMSHPTRMPKTHVTTCGPRRHAGMRIVVGLAADKREVELRGSAALQLGLPRRCSPGVDLTSHRLRREKRMWRRRGSCSPATSGVKEEADRRASVCPCPV